MMIVDYAGRDQPEPRARDYLSIVPERTEQAWHQLTVLLPLGQPEKLRGIQLVAQLFRERSTPTKQSVIS